MIRRHGEIYTDEYGWDSRFRDLVADIAHEFIRDFDPRLEL